MTPYQIYILRLFIDIAENIGTTNIYISFNIDTKADTFYIQIKYCVEQVQIDTNINLNYCAAVVIKKANDLTERHINNIHIKSI